MVVLSLALGVAIFVSSYESVIAAQDSITASAKTMVGKTQWQVSRGSSQAVPETLVGAIRKLPNAIAAPIVESTVTTGPPESHSFLLFGLDLDSDATAKLYGGDVGKDLGTFLALKFSNGGIVVSKTFAERHGLKVGQSIPLQARSSVVKVPIAAITQDPRISAAGSGYVGFMELHAAQAILETPGLVDRIDVSGVSKSDLATICPSCEVEAPGKLSSAAQDALGRIHSLLGVSVIALLVGVLLIYNSVQVSVLERLKDIAIIRAIGATRIQVFSFLLAEWLVIGILGSSLGLGLGLLLAYALLEYTKRTINTMLPLMGEAHVSATPLLLLAGLLVGVTTTLVAAYFPIQTASRVRPLEILRPYTFRRAHRYHVAFIVGVVLCIVGNFAIAKLSLSIALGLCVTGIVFLGVALLFPQIVLVVANLGRPLLRKLKKPEPYLALDGLIKTPHRTAFTIMTFGCALAMTVATETLVEGFRVTTGQWMNSAFPFDISVMGNDLAANVYGNQVLPTSVVQQVESIPGVQNAYGVRKLLTPFKGSDVMMIGFDIERYQAARKGKNMGDWPPHFSDPSTYSKFKQGKGIYISTNFESLYQVHPGDTISMQAPLTTVQVQVLGSVDDLSWPHGALIVNRELIQSAWNDNVVSYVDMSVKPGFKLAEVKQAVIAKVGNDRSAFAFDRQEIRDVTDSVLEQAVQMANLQAAIAVFIGLLGIVNAIWIGVMNRRKEIALWRSIGVTRQQIVKIILYEGFFVSVVAGLIGTIGGLYGGWVPLRSFSFDVTGYLYPIAVPWAHVIVVGCMAIVLGVLAGLLPALHAAKLPILESIGYE